MANLCLCSIFSKVVILNVVNRQGSKICPVSLYLLRFPRYCPIYVSEVMWPWGVMWPKIDIFKSCNLVGSKPIGLGNLIRFALSLTVAKITSNLRFRGHVTWGVMLPKTDIFKSCNLVGSKPIGLENLLRFALSLTVAKITSNLRFRGHVTLKGHVTQNGYCQKL